MKKILAIILSMVLIISVCPLGLFSITTSAESTIVNIYDAQTFETGLTTVNADIVLWNDVTYSGSIEVLCHSIDLNGYKLVYENEMIIASECLEIVFLDSMFINDSENTGKLEIRKGLYGPTSNLIIENGVVCIYNSDGEDGENGARGSTGSYLNAIGKGGSGGNGRAGKSGKDGGNGVTVNSFYVKDGKINVYGGNGGSGGSGGNGGDGGDSNGPGGDGGNGGAGGNAGNAGNGIVSNTVEIFNGVLEINGGSGGNGGAGGNGGSGGLTYGPYYSNGTKGSGGNGGNGGSGGHGITAAIVKIFNGDIVVRAGNGGLGRDGGNGGNSGSDAPGGCGILADSIITYNGQLKTYGGEGPQKISPTCGGGSGINGNLTVNGGYVYAYGKLNGAGIGGSGNTDHKDGFDVRINGGYVLAQGDGNGFDIGGGYDGSVIGTPGTLEVTGGTLEFATYGRATNVSSPVFKNCTVTGKGAYQHEGTYNADGKFTVTVDDINIDPTAYVGYDTVAVVANVSISRSTNITTPKLKGYISYKLDGREFATAPITNAVSNDGVITATASTTWIAVEGEHRLSAGYVPGDNDMYAFGGTYSESADIPLHTHEWNSEYTIDVEPTCTIPGSKSIHCGICDVQKDFATVDATGHDYANNQCQNCQEFLPLIIFKDYDGTVLSGEYYYLGDSIVEPNKPDRKADNIYTYIFIGWDKEVTVCDGDAVYTAVYESTPIEYTVVFKNYDGTVLSSNTYHYGDAVVVPSIDPQKPSDLQYEYIFAGWDSVVCACNGDKVYTAVFTSEFVEYTVTFKNHDGSIISTKTYRYGDTVEIPADPNKASDTTYTYSFAGWDKKVTSARGDTVYTATYNSNYINYVVTFKNSDGTILSQRNYHYGDIVVEPNVPTKSADNIYTYTFAGWDKTVVNCAGDTTYTATYTPNYIDYTVIFKNYNGVVLSTKTYHYGDGVVAPSTPTKPSDNTYTYTFAGWDKPITNCTGNTTYTATYTPNYIDYTVVFKNYNGVVLSTKTYHYGDNVIEPSAPTKSADNTYTYTFAGWDKTVVNCAGDTTYTATYTPNYIDYTVIFKNYNGVVLSSKTYHYGDGVVAPSTPTKPSDNTYTYTFAGWDKTVVNCAGNTTYTATYNSTYIDYTVTFKNWNGDVLSTKTYHYGDKVTAPSNPTKKADKTYTYTFDGWDKAVVNCTGNATYTAEYTPVYINYTVAFKNWDNTVISSQNYHYGDSVIMPTNPTRPYDENYIYTFAGWDKEITACNGNTVYTATYSKTAIAITSIKITTNPNKLTYLEGESFDKSGMVVTAYYNNDTSAVINNYTVSGYTSTPGIKTIIISYEDKTATFEVKVEALKQGWLLADNVWYYYIDNVKQTGWQYIDNHWYYLADNGAMATGWINLGGTWYYLNQSGAMQTGWQYIGNTWYYMNEGGAMTTGWQYVGNTWYYMNESGAMQTGWLYQGGTWYYLAEGGNMVTGWQYIGSSWYYFHDSGNMATGWLLQGNAWYYLAEGGNMLTDWQYIDGNWYYFYSSGAMATNIYISGGYINSSGIWYV